MDGAVTGWRRCISQLIMARVVRDGEPVSGRPQNLRIRGIAGGETAEGALRREVVQELTKPGTRRKAKPFLQVQAIQGRSGMKEGILGIAPTLERRRGHRRGQIQQQGRKIPIELPVQFQLLGLRERGQSAFPRT